MADSAPEPKEVRLVDLRAGDDAVLILARVVSAQRREITRRSDGGRRPVLSGLLSDGTATVRFTWWDPPAEGVERGTVLRAAPVTVREYQGRVEVAFSWKTRVEPASEVELPQVTPESLPLRTIATLQSRDEGFRLEGRIVRVAPKSVTVGQDRRQIHEGVLADASGAVSFTAWTDFRLVPGEAVRLTGAYVRTFRGRPQLVLDERSRVDRLKESTLPDVETLLPSEPVRLDELEARRGSEVARVEGVVIGLLPPSGLVYRCPECGRAVQKGLCRVHGTVAGTPDLRARLVLDDGTAGATVNLDRPQTEKVWGRSLAEGLERLRSTPDPSVLEEELFESVFGKRYQIQGRAVVDDFGLTVYPESIEAASGEATARVETVRRRVSGRGA
ncbi:MAG TPA: hypothetical protein VFG07_03285 [Thermoplasmata archaeon]|nr:hypothetical protein [Thermoplasmata archaeon]